MVLSQFQGMFLPPGMGLEAYSTEVDFSGIIYGPLHHCVLAPASRSFIGADSTDTGNTGNTKVLRGGLVMAISTVDNLWYPFEDGGANGLGIAKGILLWTGLNMTLGGGASNRQMGAILIKGNVQATGVCLASSSTYGLPQTGAGLKVRQDLLYNITFDDDFTAMLSRP